MRVDQGRLNGIILFLWKILDFLHDIILIIFGIFLIIITVIDDAFHGSFVEDVEAMLEMRLPDLLLRRGGSAEADRDAVEAAFSGGGCFFRFGFVVDDTIGHEDGDGKVGGFFRSKVGSQDFAEEKRRFDDF